MRRVFLGNFQFEHQLAGKPATTNERLTELAHRLAFAWILVADPGDIVVLPERFEAGFLTRLKREGLPRILPWSRVAGSRVAGKVELVPWGWSDVPREFARRFELVTNAPPHDAVRAVNSRRFSFECETSAGIGLPGAAAPTTLDQVTDCLRGLTAEAGWVIKAEFGMSARERILGRGPDLSTPSAGWVRKRLARDGVVFFEPWVDRIEEAGIQFDIPLTGSPQCVGVTGLLTDESGAYVGTRFDPDAELEARFADAVLQGLRAAERAQAAGYFGPMGIDAMRYRAADGSIAVRALQDINGRWTMGRLSLGGRRWLRAGERGEWIQSMLRASPDAGEAFVALTDAQPAGTRLVRTSPWEIEGRRALGVSALRYLPPKSDSAMWEAYRRTTYRVDAGDQRFALRVGERPVEFDAWLAAQGARCWAFVTASNPRSRVLPEGENRERHALLLRMVAERGWPNWPGAGVGDDPSWAPEVSLLIAGVSREEGMALGRAFEQNAIVWGEVGGVPELVAMG